MEARLERARACRGPQAGGSMVAMRKPAAPLLLLSVTLALACTGRVETSPGGADVDADADAGAGANGGAGADGAGGVAAAGDATPPAGGTGGAPPPWLQAREDCAAQPVSIYLTGNIRDMETGEAACERTILVCGDSLTSEVVYDSNTASCPWAEGSRAALASREDGAPVCCDDWERAKVSKDPCDPLADADCDGVPNDDDADTLRAPAAGG